NSGRRRSRPLDRQDPAADRQFEIFRDDAGKLRSNDKLVVELVEVDRRILPLESEYRERQALEDAINMPLQVLERLPRITPSKNGHCTASAREVQTIHSFLHH